MKKAELKAVLTLNNSQFVRNVKSAIQMGKDMAKQFARQPISTSFVAGALAARKAVKLTAGALQSLGRIAITSAKAATVAYGLYGASLVYVAHKAIDAAAELETLQKTFGVMLGSQEKGNERIKELTHFANDRGLRLINVAEASRTLEGLTKGALSGAKGLEFVSNVALGTNKNFEDMAEKIGRIYDAFRSGTSVGDELRSLQQMGAISGGARRKMEGLNSIQQGAAAWQVLQKELSKYDGMLNVMSGTWNMRMQRFKDSIEQAMRAFGAPLMEGLKPFLTGLTDVIFTSEKKFSEIGKKFADGITTAMNFMVGVFQQPSSLIDPLIDGLKAGMLSVGNVLVAALKAGINVIASEGFFSNLASGFYGLAQIVAGQLHLAFQKPIAWFMAAIQKMVQGLKNTFDDIFGRMGANSLDIATQNMWMKLKNASGVGTSPEDRQRMDQLFDRRQKLNRDRNSTMEDFYKNIINAADVEQIGKATINEGKRDLNASIQGFFGNMSDGFKEFKVEDIFGAGDALKQASESIKKTAKSGEQTLNIVKAAVSAQLHGPAVATSRIKTAGWTPFKGTKLGAGHPLVGASMVGNVSMTDRLSGTYKSPLDAPAKRTTSLLPFRERRAMQDALVAEAMVVGGKNIRQVTPGSLGAVRSGDRKRMQEVQRERLRERFGVDKTNQILELIQKRFDELVGGK